MADSDPQIPLNFRTIVFCFLMGTVLSPLIGLIPSRFLIFVTPESWYTFYWWLVLASFVVLPIWSFLLVRPYKPLPAIGGITFILYILLAFLVLLFPKINL